MNSSFGSHTLRNLGLLLLAICVVLGVSDLFRGTGGAAWLRAADATPAGAEGVSADGTATLFRGVRVFDGQEVLSRADVLVVDGRIDAVADSLDAPEGAVVVEGEGRTLLPGLIDSHTHAFGPVLRAALMVGVTTELDMFTEPNGAAVLRGEQERGEALGRADLFSAGVLATSPGGHGTEYGLEIPTLETPEEADAFVQARLDEGSDYIKIVYDGGSLGRRFTSLDLPTVQALIEAAHARDLLAVVHVARQQDALDVIDAGADGIVHVFYDEPASDEAVARIHASGAFVVATLSVLESVAGGTGGEELLADPDLAPYIGSSERSGLANGFPTGSGRERVLSNGIDTVRRLHQAGVRILAGTDAPNPGTAHGISMHRELELLVRAGLSPTEALAAATSVPTDAFGLGERGRIAPGHRADLVLVEGDPTDDILATRKILGVWKLGVRADRDGYRTEAAAAAAPAAAAATGDGLITDFESGEIDSAFGSGWMINTDEMMGGSSTATMEVVDGGAAGTARSLAVAGTIVRGSGPAVWAGPMYFPGAQQFAATDLSAHQGIEFWLRGDGNPVTVMMFAQSLGQMPAVQVLQTSDEWTQHRLPFADFTGVDASGLQAVLFSGTQPGEFAFALDQLRVW